MISSRSFPISRQPLAKEQQRITESIGRVETGRGEPFTERGARTEEGLDNYTYPVFYSVSLHGFTA